MLLERVAPRGRWLLALLPLALALGPAAGGCANGANATGDLVGDDAASGGSSGGDATGGGKDGGSGSSSGSNSSSGSSSGTASSSGSPGDGASASDGAGEGGDGGGSAEGGAEAGPVVCTSSAQCAGVVSDAGALGVCNTTTSKCVECLVNSSCHAPTPWCDTATDTCVACLPSNDSCPTGEYCSGTSCAPGCKTSSDCPLPPAADAGTDAGAGGTKCDPTSHACVECTIDGDCPLGSTCVNDTCAAGCNAQHPCPSGDGCCSGQCLPLNTTSNCGACGAACDTTSGHSQGAACVNAGCTYTGCASGWGDCTAGSPDADGCETNLGTAGKRQCSVGTCVASGTCCADADCTAPPSPLACYPSQGTCTTPGAACTYTENSGSVVCGGTTCCNAIDGTCNPDCSLSCASGFGNCTSDPSKGCETNTGTSTADCGACNHGCSNAHVASESCAGGLCNSTCQSGWGNCSYPIPPAADDGCESNLTTCYGTPCCAQGQCADPHSNGQGQTYNDCSPLGTPGNAATYSQTMAGEAAAAYPTQDTLFIVTCGSGANASTAIDICDPTGSTCVASWCYAGPCAGYSLAIAGGYPTYCPNAGGGNPTWD